MRLLASLILLLASACGPTSEIAETEDEISTRTPAYVTLTRDTRRCAYPLCGGYWITDVNRGTEPRYVSELDFGESGFDHDTTQDVLEAFPEELVIRGRLGRAEQQFGTRPLIVLEAYRGLPGAAVDPGDLFFGVTSNDPPINCFTAPCNNDWATRLNRRFRPVSFTRVSATRALGNLVDEQWLIQRVEQGGALVAGRLQQGATFPGGPETVLDASQVFLRLPESAGPCPQIRFPACAEGTVRPEERDANRCVLPAGDCVPAAACPEIAPLCDDGYQLASWTGADSCPAFACDPSFVVETHLRCPVVRCAAGFHCVEEGPDACVPDLTCAVVLCGPNTTCIEENGSAACVPTTWTSEQTSFGTSNPYRNNEVLGWVVTGEPGTLALRLHFARFDLEAGYDFVTILTEAGDELASYTGRLGEITTDAFPVSSLVVVFESDPSVTRPGFTVDRIDALVR